MTRVGRWLAGFLFISIGLGSVSMSAPPFQSREEGGISEEEYEIYSAVIKEKYVEPATKLLVIEDRTFRYDFSNENDEPWKDKPKNLKIDQSAVEDYETKNSRHFALDKPSFKLPVKIALITDADLRAIFHGKWGELEWIGYYRRYPDSRGFIMLSRIGFNTERTQALVYVGSRCGPGCGDIHFLLLEKANGVWTTKKELRNKNLG